MQYVDLGRDQFSAALLGAGLPPFIADSLCELYETIRAGHAAFVTNHVDQLAGRPARSYEEFAASQLASAPGDAP